MKKDEQEKEAQSDGQRKLPAVLCNTSLKSQLRTLQSDQQPCSNHLPFGSSCDIIRDRNEFISCWFFSRSLHWSWGNSYCNYRVSQKVWDENNYIVLDDSFNFDRDIFKSTPLIIMSKAWKKNYYARTLHVPLITPCTSTLDYFRFFHLYQKLSHFLFPFRFWDTTVLRFSQALP